MASYPIRSSMPASYALSLTHNSGLYLWLVALQMSTDWQQGQNAGQPWNHFNRLDCPQHRPAATLHVHRMQCRRTVEHTQFRDSTWSKACWPTAVTGWLPPHFHTLRLEVSLSHTDPPASRQKGMNMNTKGSFPRRKVWLSGYTIVQRSSALKWWTPLKLKRAQWDRFFYQRLSQNREKVDFSHMRRGKSWHLWETWMFFGLKQCWQCSGETAPFFFFSLSEHTRDQLLNWKTKVANVYSSAERNKAVLI